MFARQLAVQPLKRSATAQAEIERAQRQRLRQNLPEYSRKRRWSSGSTTDVKIRHYKGRMYVLEHSLENIKAMHVVNKERSSLGFFDILFIMSVLFFTSVVVFMASRFWFLSDLF